MHARRLRIHNKYFVSTGSQFRAFVEEYGDSKFNIALATSGDGVQVRTISMSSVFPQMLRIETLPPDIRKRAESQHLSILLPNTYENFDLYMGPLVAELKQLRSPAGIEVITQTHHAFIFKLHLPHSHHH